MLLIMAKANSLANRIHSAVQQARYRAVIVIANRALIIIIFGDLLGLELVICFRLKFWRLRAASPNGR